MFGITRTSSRLRAARRATCVASAAVLGTCHVLAAPALVQNQPHQPPESFAAAIHDNSTSPVYVLITVVNDATGEARTGCNTANLLLGAIHMEYGLAYDAAAVANAQNMALTNTSHVFHFSKPEALANVAFRYSPDDMAAARRLIEPLNDQQLREGFSDRGELQVSSLAVQDARACALIERGLWVRMADRTGKLLLGR
jgi:hypothetical protein